MNMSERSFEGIALSGTPHLQAYPSYPDLLERAFVTAGVVLACVLFMSVEARPAVVSNPVSTGIATAGLWLGSMLAGLLFAGQKDRAAVIGVSLGIPLGFFYFQNSYARSAGMIDLSQGSARILAISGFLAIAGGVASWFWRRHKRRKFSLTSSAGAN